MECADHSASCENGQSTTAYGNPGGGISVIPDWHYGTFVQAYGKDCSDVYCDETFPPKFPCSTVGGVYDSSSNVAQCKEQCTYSTHFWASPIVYTIKRVGKQIKLYVEASATDNSHAVLSHVTVKGDPQLNVKHEIATDHPAYPFVDQGLTRDMSFFLGCSTNTDTNTNCRFSEITINSFVPVE